MLEADNLRQAVEAILADLQPAEEELTSRRAALQADLERAED